MKLRCLDLFSGIGGFSLALRPIAKTVAYCEINEACRRVLRKNMQSGNLDTASIFNDVTKLHANDLKHLRPNMISAGFPCQDLSIANPHGLGLDGEKSGLFKEVLRLIDELPSIEVLFLENSSNIVHCCMNTIKNKLKRRGFSLKYVLIRASDVGAYHKRLRWYCIAYKPSAIPLLKPINNKIIKHKWDNCMGTQRTLKISSSLFKERMVTRCMMLGNSIVPQCAIVAWNEIIKHVKEKDVEVKIIQTKKRTLNLVFVDGQTIKTRTLWATPTYSIWHTYKSLTQRGTGILSNQVFYHKDSGLIAKDYNNYVCNPVFVECLMGYPMNWTK